MRHAFLDLSPRGSLEDYFRKRFEQRGPSGDINNCIIIGIATMYGPMTLVVKCNFDVLILRRYPPYMLHMYLTTIPIIWWKKRSILTKGGPGTLGGMWNIQFLLHWGLLSDWFRKNLITTIVQYWRKITNITMIDSKIFFVRYGHIPYFERTLFLNQFGIGLDKRMRSSYGKTWGSWIVAFVNNHSRFLTWSDRSLSWCDWHFFFNTRFCIEIKCHMRLCIGLSVELPSWFLFPEARFSFVEEFPGKTLLIVAVSLAW